MHATGRSGGQQQSTDRERRRVWIESRRRDMRAPLWGRLIEEMTVIIIVWRFVIILSE